MTKRMLIDATHAEETRVVVLDGNRLEDFDVETSTKRQLKGNIYLAKVVRVEPSLQAAFVEYGGNRHGFLAFGEIHPDYYQIPVADRQRLIEHAGRGGAARGGGGRPRGRGCRGGDSESAPPAAEPNPKRMLTSEPEYRHGARRVAGRRRSLPRPKSTAQPGGQTADDRHGWSQNCPRRDVREPSTGGIGRAGGDRRHRSRRIEAARRRRPASA